MLASCGGEEPGGTEAAEGEPVVLDDVSYNVGITRFLNPDDPEDAAYLVGQPPAPGGEYYLGVFIEIINESDETKLTAGDYAVADTLENEYHPLPSDSPYALDDRARADRDGQLPVPTRPRDRPERGLPAALPRQRRRLRQPAAEARDRRGRRHRRDHPRHLDGGRCRSAACS